MKTEPFVKLPAAAMFDPRMSELMDKEGTRGTGAYWYIREKVAMFSRGRFYLDNLKAFARKGITHKYMVKVVTTSGLFCTNGRYYWPDELNKFDEGDTAPPASAPDEPTADPVSEPEEHSQEERGTSLCETQKAANDTEKRATDNDGICPKNHGRERNLPEISLQQREFCQNFEQKNDSKSNIHESNRSEKSTEYGDNSLIDSTPNRTTSAAKAVASQDKKSPIRRKKDRKIDSVVVDVVDKADNGQVNNLKTTPAEPASQTDTGPTSAKNGRQPAASPANRHKTVVPLYPPYEETGPVRPVLSLPQLLAAISADSEWTHLACLKSGYGALLMRFLPQALEYFRRHIITYAKAGEMLHEADVQRYFANFVSPGKRTSRDLLHYLQGLQQSYAPPGTVTSPHEQRVDGQRTYNGRRIPPYAPPRPTADSVWNDEQRRWEAG